MIFLKLLVLYRLLFLVESDPTCFCQAGQYCCPGVCSDGFGGKNYMCFCWINQNRQSQMYSGPYTFGFFPKGEVSNGYCDWCVNPTSPLSSDLHYDYTVCPDPDCGSYGSSPECHYQCELWNNRTHMLLPGYPWKSVFIPKSEFSSGYCGCDGIVDPCSVPPAFDESVHKEYRDQQSVEEIEHHASNENFVDVKKNQEMENRHRIEQE